MSYNKWKQNISLMVNLLSLNVLYLVIVKTVIFESMIVSHVEKNTYDLR